ncbi:MAG: response regulator [Thermodesulfobacteriota bacterium]
MREVKILVVDDEERFLTSMAKLLAKKGCAVTTAASGREALEKLAQQEVDVIILDVKMPGMDGLATFRETKKRFPLVEVIMLTGHGTVDTALEAIKLGAFDYLLKPCGLDELLEKTREAADRKWVLEQKKH